jgi:two-component system OmpR family sensor kinase
MARTAGRAGFWQSLRDLPERTPLRVKLMTAVLALVTIALIVISVAGIAILKNSLLGPDDSGMQDTISSVATSTVSTYLSGGDQRTFPGEFVDWIPAGGVAQRVILPTSQGYQRGYGGPFPTLGRPESEPVIPRNPAWINSHLGKPFTLTSASGGIKWRVLMQTYQVTPAGTSGTVVLAVDVTSVYTTIGKLATIDLLVSLAVIALIAILGIGLIRASLRALTDVEQTAGAIAAGDLSKRVPERDPRTEMGRLGRSLNVMLSQIESAFQSQSRSEAAARRSEERMRQFVGDASHELRTPLTAIRGFAEYYRQRGGIAVGEAASTTSGEGTGALAAANGGRGKAAHPLAPADMDRIMRRVEQESARMGILVEDMLLLARLDQQRPLMASPVDLLTLAADAVHDARVVAPARSINLTVNSGQALLVIGDEVRLRQVIGNLMSNALTHTPDGTPIDVLIRSGDLDEAVAATAVARPDVAEPSLGDEPAADNRPAIDDVPAAGDMHWDAEHVPPPPEAAAPGSPTGRLPAERAPGGPAAVLEVTDHGPGLTSEQAGHVFERFYRADPARTTGGTGLGLAIVAALVAAHDGAAWVRSRPGEGATFCIALPLSPEAMQSAENDFDGEADDMTAETGTVENDTGSTGTACTASARAELGG